MSADLYSRVPQRRVVPRARVNRLAELPARATRPEKHELQEVVLVRRFLRSAAQRRRRRVARPGGRVVEISRIHAHLGHRGDAKPYRQAGASASSGGRPTGPGRATRRALPERATQT